MAALAKRPKQPTPQELLDSLLDFLQRKFYQGYAVTFAKDRPRLLKWVVLWPAAWLNKRGVTLPADRYREIFMTVFMDTLRHGTTEKINYLPAYLATVIQRHFSHHEEEIYDEAKSIRNLVENALAITGKCSQPAPDPVLDLATAASLLKPKKRHLSPSKTSQLDLL